MKKFLSILNKKYVNELISVPEVEKKDPEFLEQEKIYDSQDGLIKYFYDSEYKDMIKENKNNNKEKLHLACEHLFDEIYNSHNNELFKKYVNEPDEIRWIASFEQGLFMQELVGPEASFE